MHAGGSLQPKLIEAADEPLVQVGLKSFVRLLLDQSVAEKLMIAEEILRRLLIVVGSPIAGVIFEVALIGIGKIGGAGIDVVVHRREVFIGGELVVQVLIIIVSISVLITIAVAILIAIIITSVSVSGIVSVTAILLIIVALVVIITLVVISLVILIVVEPVAAAIVPEAASVIAKIPSTSVAEVATVHRIMNAVVDHELQFRA